MSKPPKILADAFERRAKAMSWRKARFFPEGDPKQCQICGKTALFKFGKQGACREHKDSIRARYTKEFGFSELADENRLNSLWRKNTRMAWADIRGRGRK